ncbi:MAG: DUF4058 family protein [Gemmataceae bacterium]
MSYLFPGMDPYLEHPILWEGFHARLIPAIANQLQPRLDPRYVASIEERVFVEGPQHRVPDVWVQQTSEHGSLPEVSAEADTATILEVEDLEIRQKYLAILDGYNDMKLVAIVEALSPTNKRPGPGKDSYLAKQHEILARDCHLIEIDLHRNGDHVLSVPEWRLQGFQKHDYLVCINRWPKRNRFEVYSATLRQRLPRVKVPLAAPDPDVVLDVQAAVEQVYHDGRYTRRIRYGEPGIPPLDDQAWADDILRRSRAEKNGASDDPV